MIRGFYSARSGLIAHQEHMSVLSNNLANVNTYGFKPMRTAFSDLMYQNLNRVRGENEAQTGHGVKINKNDIIMNPGALEPTYRELDFAIIDEQGFFKVETEEGEQQYTRDGSFTLSNVDDAYYLVDGNGHYVLDADDERIEVTFNEYTQETTYQTDADGNTLYEQVPVVDANGNPVLDLNGAPTYENGDPIIESVETIKANPDYGDMIFDPESIGVFRFENPWGLESVNGNSFLESAMSGPAEAIEQPSIQQRYLERSATDVGDQMANVIEASKAFSFSSRMVQVADEIEQTVNQLR